MHKTSLVSEVNKKQCIRAKINPYVTAIMMALQLFHILSSCFNILRSNSFAKTTILPIFYPLIFQFKVFDNCSLQ